MGFNPIFFLKKNALLQKLFEDVCLELWLSLAREGSWDSIVDIGTSYGLEDRGVGVRVLVGSRIFSSPDQL
jgi:hypothetical protein